MVRPPLSMTVLCLLLVLPVLWWRPAAAAFETQAEQAILIDITTGSVLFEKNADDRMPTSSMSKIMTMYMVFQALDEGALSLDDELLVSEHAWRTGGAITDGSTTYLDVHSSVRVEDLIRGVIVQSGNDASIVLAEGIAGTEEEFARRMTETALELGMTGSNFRNATGLPDPEHYSTARDLALLARRMISDHPEYYHYYSEREFTYGVSLSGEPITQRNRNPLLGSDLGVDGLKTGHTSAAGYGLTASAIQDGRRLIMVVNGLPSETARREESRRLVSWGFRAFETVRLFAAGETVAMADTWLGTPGEVALVLPEDLAITVPSDSRDSLRVAACIRQPVPAPLTAGQPIPASPTAEPTGAAETPCMIDDPALGAALVISADGMPTRQVPLVAGAEVARSGFLGRSLAMIGHFAGQLIDF